MVRNIWFKVSVTLVIDKQRYDVYRYCKAPNSKSAFALVIASLINVPSSCVITATDVKEGNVAYLPNKCEVIPDHPMKDLECWVPKVDIEQVYLCDEVFLLHMNIVDALMWDSPPSIELTLD